MFLPTHQNTDLEPQHVFQSLVTIFGQKIELNLCTNNFGFYRTTLLSFWRGAFVYYIIGVSNKLPLTKSIKLSRSVSLKIPDQIPFSISKNSKAFSRLLSLTSLTNFKEYLLQNPQKSGMLIHSRVFKPIVLYKAKCLPWRV